MKDKRKLIMGVLVLLVILAGGSVLISHILDSRREVSGSSTSDTQGNTDESVSGEKETQEGAAAQDQETTQQESQTETQETTESQTEDQGMTQQESQTEDPETIQQEETTQAHGTTAQEETTEPEQTTEVQTTESASEAATEPTTEATTEQEEQSGGAEEVQASAVIAIDAGHQGRGNYEQEPIGPGADETKAKVSSGTQGVSTGVPEYELTLEISLKLKEEFLARGYEVVMIRETNDVNLSNRERAEIANEAGADVFLRIHADGSENQSANGASALYPSADNPYVAYLSEDSKRLSEEVVNHLCEETGARNRGAVVRDDMSGINWCEVPVTIVEMGFMTNPEEDEKMQTDEYQALIVKGICDGVEAYLDAR